MHELIARRGNERIVFMTDDLGMERFLKAVIDPDDIRYTESDGSEYAYVMFVNLTPEAQESHRGQNNVGVHHLVMGSVAHVNDGKSPRIRCRNGNKRDYSSTNLEIKGWLPLGQRRRKKERFTIEEVTKFTVKEEGQRDRTFDNMDDVDRHIGRRVREEPDG